MSLVSVIIPVYGVEQYLAKCLDSIINQTYNNIEILCVNDCSPDNSAEILENYSKIDNRIKIINRKKNGGLSAARNTGLDVAKGKYIYFLDSDDWIDLNYINSMVELIEKSNCDIILNTNIQSVKDDIITPFEWNRYNKKLLEGEFLNTEDAINYSQVMIWAHLYKKSFLDKYNLRFPEGYIHEDEYFQHISKIRCNKIFCYWGEPYYYRQRQQSIMTSRKSKVISVAKIIDLLIDFYIQNNFLSQYLIKLPIINILFSITNSVEYDYAKKILDKLISSSLNFDLSDFENFQIKFLTESSCFTEFKKNSGRNLFFTYIRYKLPLKPKISIIIPVFRVEPYLRECLDSVVNQTLKDIEIICVNDCSPDNCSKILDKYSRKDTRIKIINREINGGLSAARNTGLKAATGEYVCFLDSDDWLDENYIEKSAVAIQSSGADIVINRSILTEKINISSRYIHPKDKLYQNSIFIQPKEAIENIVWNAWTKIMKRSFIDKFKLRFPEGYINEDLYFHYVSLAHTNKIFLISESNYHYRSRNSGISKNEGQKDIEIVKIFDLIYDYYKQNELLNNGIKIFSVMPFFKVDSDDKYEFYKKYFTKIKYYIKENKDLYNDIDLFFMQSILETKNFDEYINKYSPNITLEYIKQGRIIKNGV